MIRKSGFGGGCHWCTEAVFASLRGVKSVQQGWIASEGEFATFSEAVVVTFYPSKIGYDKLIEIHLYTHSCTSEHSMRDKYRSAIYTFNESDLEKASELLSEFQNDFDDLIVTKVLRFCDFKLNREESLNYYFNDPEKPFCERYINPKLQLLMDQFSETANFEKLQHLKSK